MGISVETSRALAMGVAQLLVAGEPAVALAAAREATTLAGTTSELPWLLRGMSARRSGELREAAEALTQSLTIKESPEALYEFAATVYEMGSQSDARQIATSLREKFPRWAPATARFFLP